MPFAIVKRDDEYCVVRLAAGERPQETKACHPSLEAARRHLAALRANVEDA